MVLYRLVAAIVAMISSIWGSSSTSVAQNVREPAATFAGTFKKADTKRSVFYIEMSDGNTMEFRLTRKTQIRGKKGTSTWKIEELEDGDTVEVEGRRVLREVVAETITVTLRARDAAK
jgi:hypothetical protein